MSQNTTVFTVFGTKRVKAGYDVERQQERFAYDELNVDDILLKIYQEKVLNGQDDVILQASGRSITMLMRVVNQLGIPVGNLSFTNESRTNRQSGEEYTVIGIEALFNGEMEMPVPRRRTA